MVSADVLQALLDAALADLDHEREARRNEAREHRNAMAQQADAHRQALIQQAREFRQDIMTRLDALKHAVTAQTRSELTNLVESQIAHQREKGTKAPNVPLEHYYLTTEYARTRHTKATRCTSGQKQYCLAKMREFAAIQPTQQLIRKAANGVDIRQYVKRAVNQRVEASLAEEYRGVVSAHCLLCSRCRNVISD